MPHYIEIVVEDVDGARIAAEEGADSIELCARLDDGGLTPPPELIKNVVDVVRNVRPETQCHILILNSIWL